MLLLINTGFEAGYFLTIKKFYNPCIIFSYKPKCHWVKHHVYNLFILRQGAK
jgi:hypothetical protein